MVNGPKCRGFGWVDFRQKNANLRCFGLRFEPTLEPREAKTPAPEMASDVISMDRTPSIPSSGVTSDWQGRQDNIPALPPMSKGALMCLGALYETPGDQLMRCNGVEVRVFAGDSPKSDVDGLKEKARSELVDRYGQLLKSVCIRAFSDVPSMLAESPLEVARKLTKMSESILTRSGQISYRCGEMLIPGYRRPPRPEPDDSDTM